MKYIVGKITRKVADFLRGGVLSGKGERYVPPTEPPDVVQFYEIPKICYAVATVFEIPVLCRANASVSQIPQLFYAIGEKVEIPRVFHAKHT